MDMMFHRTPKTEVKQVKGRGITYQTEKNVGEELGEGALSI